MRRRSALLALVLTIGSTAGCAELTTTGVPADSGTGATAAGEAMAAQADPLTGTSWTLASSNTDGVDPAVHTITAEFSDGRMAGQAPVNTYSASYELHDGGITLGPVVSTKMAGEAEAMAAEDAYFAGLAEVSGIEVYPEELILTADGGAILTYAPDQHGDQGGGGDMDEETAAAQALADTLVGMPADEAQSAAEEAGYTFRVLAEDGVNNAVTSDYRPDRINVEIESGKVTKVSVG
jgi:heat shock protein HslJ